MIGYIVTAATVFGLIVFGAGAIIAALWVLEQIAEKLIGQGHTWELLIAAGLLVKKDRGKVDRERTSIFGNKE